MDCQHLLPAVIEIARQAGQGIMAVYQQEVKVQRKDDNSPVTEADLVAHDIISRGLTALAPQLPVVSEEDVALPYPVRREWTRYWLVDPLDGTREFIKRNGEFTVNIALIDAKQPVLGVVYAPALDLLFYAVQGSGAFRQINDQPPSRIHSRPYDPTQVTVAGSRSNAGERLRAFLDRMGPHMLISMGSSLKICLVAEGRADIYPRLGPTYEWDTAAAQCILEQAGGRLIGMDNQPFSYNTKESLLNPEFLAVGQAAPDWTLHIKPA